MDLDDEELKVTRMMNGADRNSRVRVKQDIEVNEYVRTKNGYIIRVDENTIIFNLGYKEQYVDMETTKYGFTCEEEIVKHSKIISEVVNVGDYVNGKLIHKIDKGSNYCYLYYGNCKTFVDYQIKTILTKEQYLANCYKVGGEE